MTMYLTPVSSLPTRGFIHLKEENVKTQVKLCLRNVSKLATAFETHDLSIKLSFKKFTTVAVYKLSSSPSPAKGSPPKKPK